MAKVPCWNYCDLSVSLTIPVANLLHCSKWLPGCIVYSGLNINLSSLFRTATICQDLIRSFTIMRPNFLCPELWSHTRMALPLGKPIQFMCTPDYCSEGRSVIKLGQSSLTNPTWTSKGSSSKGLIMGWLHKDNPAYRREVKHCHIDWMCPWGSFQRCLKDEGGPILNVTHPMGWSVRLD